MGDVTRVAKQRSEAPGLIKVSNAQANLGRESDAVNDHNLRANMKLILTKGVSNPIVQLVTVVGLAFVLSIAIADAIRGRMSMGDLLGFLTALVSIAQPLRELVGVAGPLQQGIAAGQSLFELLDQPAEPQGGSWRVARVHGAVQFDHVSFSYARAAATQAGEPRSRERTAALSDVSLQVAAGESLAIVGRSGSGKSTLVNLLPRFYDAGGGSVRIGGRDVRDYVLQNLRDQIAVVSQDVVLFDDTIRNNIAFRRELPDAPIERAAGAVGAEGDGRAPHGSLVSGARAPLAPRAARLVVWRTDARAPPRLCLGLGAYRARRQAGGGDRQSHGWRHRQDPPHHLAGAPADRRGTEGGHRLARLRPPRRRTAHRAVDFRLAAGRRPAADHRAPPRPPDDRRRRSRRRRHRAGGRR